MTFLQAFCKTDERERERGHDGGCDLVARQQTHTRLREGRRLLFLDGVVTVDTNEDGRRMENIINDEPPSHALQLPR